MVNQIKQGIPSIPFATICYNQWDFCSRSFSSCCSAIKVLDQRKLTVKENGLLALCYELHKTHLETKIFSICWRKKWCLKNCHGCCGWLPGHCYAVAMVFWEVSFTLLCSSYGVLGDPRWLFIDPSQQIASPRLYNILLSIIWSPSA